MPDGAWSAQSTFHSSSAAASLGVDSEIDAMLQPFRRGEGSRNRETGGAGLGLTLALAIAEQHGGSLVIANRIGSGGQVAGLVAELRIPLD